MKTVMEIQDRILELQIALHKKHSKYLQGQIEILGWALEQSSEQAISTEELQKDGVNIEFG